MNTRQQIQNKKKPKKPYSNLLGNKCIHVCVCNLYTGNHEYKATNSDQEKTQRNHTQTCLEFRQGYFATTRLGNL